MSYQPLLWMWAKDGRDWRRVGSFESEGQAAAFRDLLCGGRESVTLPAKVLPRPGHCRRW